ncbi:MAG: NAD-dependent epimerase/dehydratase family protein [Flavobacteriaceae bacterium]
MKKIAITGSSGRIGRSLHWKLCRDYEVMGIDISPSSATSLISDIRDYDKLLRTFEGVDTIFHSAALHAPHVGIVPDRTFYEINVDATEKICRAALEVGVPHIVFTSTTALYGYANSDGEKAVWINQNTVPQPRTIYHKTKLEAERLLEEYSGEKLSISVMRMSRCFPEPANLMAVYRLHRGIDYRDVADAHILAGQLKEKKIFDIFIVSGKTPFLKSDCYMLHENPESVIHERNPLFAKEFDNRGWKYPDSIDRVYDSSYSESTLGWIPKRGPFDVFKKFDNENFEVLPPS